MLDRVRSNSGRNVRCAVYTRKSTEEGLEQAFNSLHAQREACEAFILSQRHEGWQVLPTAYDDGGYSGGTMERPGLEALIGDIKRGVIDIVVVYKVDRLTRSLRDFARIVDVFDASGVSFVSVTQAFNTATSMGRLTLNVLLSFAQFEREVTAERIRDKIAASKKKGMWMGGVVPPGYEVHERKLVIDQALAETVRTIFALYLELGSVRLLRDELGRRGILTKRRMTRAGLMGGRPFSRGQLYRILSSPIYVGRIPHKKTSYPGEHEAIIDQPIFDAVQELLKENAGRHRGRANSKHPSLLAGLMVTADGIPFTPSHAVNHGKRYRYYVESPLVSGKRPSSHDSDGGLEIRTGSERNQAQNRRSANGGWRLPAHEIEVLVLRRLAKFLRDPNALLDALGPSSSQADRLESALHESATMAEVLSRGMPTQQMELVRDLVDRIIIDAESITIEVNLPGLARRFGVASNGSFPNGYGTTGFDLKLPVRLRRRGVEAKLIFGDRTLEDQPPRPDPALLKMLARACCWQRALLTGAAEGPGEIARSEKLHRAYVSRVVALASLSPDVIQAILDGRQPPELTAKVLLRLAPTLPLLWDDQHRALGFAEPW